MITEGKFEETNQFKAFLAHSSWQEAAAEGRTDSRACVVNMCVLGEKSCFWQNSVFHSIDFLSISFIQGSIFKYFIQSIVSVSFKVNNPINRLDFVFC